MYERRRLRQAQLYALEVTQGWRAAQIVQQHKQQEGSPDAEVWRGVVTLFAGEITSARAAMQKEQESEEEYLRVHGIPQRRSDEDIPLP